MSNLVTVSSLRGRIKRAGREMSAIWQELCRYGCKTDSQTFFADNYHTVFMSIEYLLGYPRTARVGADSAFADRIIGLGDNSLLVR